MLITFILFVCNLLDMCLTQVPIVSPYATAPQIQSFSSSPLLGPIQNNFNTTYPYGTFTSTPLLYSAISRIVWDEILEFELIDVTIETSYVECSLIVPTRISNARIRFLVLGPDYYSTVFFVFQYFMFIPPSSSLYQNIEIQNHEKYEVILMKKYRGQIFSNYESDEGLPNVIIDDYISSSMTEIRVTTSSTGGYTILDLTFLMFNVTPTFVYQYPSVYTAFYIHPSNANTTLQFQTTVSKANYPNTFFYGLHVARDMFEDREGCELNFQSWRMYNASAYVQTLIIALRKCTTTQPYRNTINDLCYASCPEGTYPVEISKQCQQCPSPCFGCLQSNPSYCLSCFSPYLLGFVGATQTCLCPVGTYGDPVSGCFPCSINDCIECQSATVCYKCDYGLILSGGNCVCPGSTTGVVVDGRTKCIGQTMQEQCSGGRTSYVDWYCICPVGKSWKNGSCV